MSSLPPTLGSPAPTPIQPAWKMLSGVLSQIAHRAIAVCIFALVVPVGGVFFPERIGGAVRPVLVAMFILLDLAVICSLVNVVIRSRQQLETAEARNTLMASLVLLLVIALWMVIP